MASRVSAHRSLTRTRTAFGARVSFADGAFRFLIGLVPRIFAAETMMIPDAQHGRTVRARKSRVTCLILTTIVKKPYLANARAIAEEFGHTCARSRHPASQRAVPPPASQCSQCLGTLTFQEAGGEHVRTSGALHRE